MSIQGGDYLVVWHVRGAQSMRDRDQQSEHGIRKTMSPDQMSKQQDGELNPRNTRPARFVSRCALINNGRETGRPFLCFQVRLKAYEYKNQKSETKSERKRIHLY